MARRNMYPGKCTACGQQVDQYQGTIAKVNGRWAVTHDRCPAAIVEQARVAAMMRNDLDGLVAEIAPRYAAVKTLDEQIEQQERSGNWFMADKLALVKHAGSLEVAKERVYASSQGMTMDYMSDFSKESTANRLAIEWAERAYGEAGWCAECQAYTHMAGLVGHLCTRYDGPACQECGAGTVAYTVGAPGYGSGVQCKNGHDFPTSRQGIMTPEQTR